MKKRENFQRFRPYIKEHALSKEALRIFNTIDEFFKAYPGVAELDWEAFETWFFAMKASRMSKDDLPVFRAIFKNLRTKPVSVVADDILRHYITKDYATRVANEALKIGEGKVSDLDSIAELCQLHDKEVGRALTLSDLFETGGVSDAVSKASEPGLEWRLEELNISAGPLRQGDFVVVAARPEVGKTTFLASEVSHMASQIKDDRPVIWVNNEERSAKVDSRIKQAAIGLSMRDIVADQAAADAAYLKLMGKSDRILVLKNEAMNDVGKLTRLFRELKPALIVFDLLDKVDGFDESEREDIVLGKKYKWARNLAHEYGPVLAGSQASDAAEGQRWIYQNQLRGSRTDKAGEADLIIGIGMDHSVPDPNARFIHCMKNKLYGGPRSVEKDRHGKWEVSIKPEIARYEGTR